VTYDALWRSTAGDHAIVSFSHHFDPPASGFNAQAYDADAPGVAAPAKTNDQLVLRFTAQGNSTQLLMIPNSDGANAMGRIPSLTLPK
jgi:hypothetical protein